METTQNISVLNNSVRKRTFDGMTKNTIDTQDEQDEQILLLNETGITDIKECWKFYQLDSCKCRAHIQPNPRTKNCKQNPYCIYYLGLEKLDKLIQLLKANGFGEELDWRDPNVQPCGLVNNGNYCYLNSFLQIWFNDLQFRKCIYNWRPDPKWEQPISAKFDIQEVMCCMQRLFITLQYTPFATTNVNQLIELLRLNNEQQDVQEFHILFFDSIERALEFHPNGAQIRATIRRLFHSQISQTMYCSCGKTTIAESEYRSLPISIEGFNLLQAAIESFFTPEILADYKCSTCNQIGETTKTMGYKELPQVLVIQLTRYVFDSAKERHRKLNTAIRYPRILNASTLKPDVDYNDQYELCAVMIHEGANTHCGHYYDLIRDPHSRRWFMYNDENVRLEKRTPGYEGDGGLNRNTRPTTDQKNCYALIYQRKMALEDINIGGDDIEKPPNDMVKEIMDKLYDDFNRQRREKEENNHSWSIWERCIKTKHAFFKKLYRELEVKNGKILVDTPAQISFLPTELLNEVLTKEYDALKKMQTLNVDLCTSLKTSEQTMIISDETITKKLNTENTIDQINDNDRNLNSKQRLNNKIKTGDDVKSSSSEQSSTQSTSDIYDDALTHLYTPEPINDVHFFLCKHGYVSLDLIRKGDLKAVQTNAAQKLIKKYNIRWFVFQHVCEQNEVQPVTILNDTDENTIPKNEQKQNTEEQTNQDLQKQLLDNRIRTGADICVECVQELKIDASLRSYHSEHNLNEEFKRYIYPEGADIYVKLKEDESEKQVQARTATTSTSTLTMVTRRGALKNMHKIKMHSDQTIMDLKLSLMNKIKQSPSDQLLYLDDRVLDNKLTLEEARVASNNYDNPIVLIVQQRTDDLNTTSLEVENGAEKPRRMEKGFRDTALSA